MPFSLSLKQKVMRYSFNYNSEFDHMS